MLRSEFIGRNVGIEDEDRERFDADDYGFSTSLVYGLSDRTTLSVRHDWVSDMDDLELEDRHRISPAISTLIGENRQIQARLQYDFTTSDTLGDEHAAWLQIKICWGGKNCAAHGH